MDQVVKVGTRVQKLDRCGIPELLAQTWKQLGTQHRSCTCLRCEECITRIAMVSMGLPITSFSQITGRRANCGPQLCALHFRIASLRWSIYWLFVFGPQPFFASHEMK